MEIIITILGGVAVSALLSVRKLITENEQLQKEAEYSKSELEDAKKSFDYEMKFFERENTRLKNLLEISYKSK